MSDLVTQFFEAFSCIVRGVLRDARELERIRFHMLISLFPHIKEWAAEVDKSGGMLHNVEEHMQIARDIVDLIEINADTPIFRSRVLRVWMLRFGKNEKTALALQLRKQFLHKLQEDTGSATLD